MIEYLDSKQVGERVGLAHQTVRQMRVRGQIPDPDAMIGRAVGWLPETVDEWITARNSGVELGTSQPTRISHQQQRTRKERHDEDEAGA